MSGLADELYGAPSGVPRFGLADDLYGKQKPTESTSMQAGRKADISIGGFPIGSSVQGAINALQGPTFGFWTNWLVLLLRHLVNTKMCAITFAEQQNNFAMNTQ